VFPAKEFGLTEHGCIDGNPHDECRPQAMTLVVICDHLVARYIPLLLTFFLNLGLQTANESTRKNFW